MVGALEEYGIDLERKRDLYQEDPESHALDTNGREK
jgi:hypothetical protein